MLDFKLGDGGTSLPADVTVVAGVNSVDGEDAADVSDNGTGHGTHVAGIVRRIAPGAELHIYRVCARESGDAHEMAIAKAVRHAADAGCDIINLSLGQDSEPLAITRQIRRAHGLGCVVVAATGNNWGAEVAYPARTKGVLAVTACGLRAAAPDGAIADDIFAPPPDEQSWVFFARFSNIGPEVSFISPGVAILSSVSPTETGAMDGTSMACPVTTALVARLLSSDDTLLNSDRDQERSDAIVAACHKAAQPFGFGRDMEGSGMIRLDR